MRPLPDGQFHYLFGRDLLIAPIHSDSLERQVSLPHGHWRYFFDDRETLQGPGKIQREFPLDQFPVFVRDGAIIPINVTRPYTGLGDTNSGGFTTWLIYPNATNQFTLWHPQTHPHPEQTTLTVAAGSSLRIEFSGKHDPHILRILSPAKPARVLLDGSELAEGRAWTYDHAHQRLVIRTTEYAQGVYQIVSAP